MNWTPRKLAWCFVSATLALAWAGCDEPQTTRTSSLVSISEQPEVWQEFVDPDDPPVFRERVYWVEAPVMERTSMLDEVLVVADDHPLAALEVGDVIVSDWHSGYWLRIERKIDENNDTIGFHTATAEIDDILEYGRLVARIEGQQPAANGAGLVACAGTRCSSTVDFGFSGRNLMARTEPGGSLAVSATQARFDFRPTLRYEQGVERRRIGQTRRTFTRMRVSGSYDFEADFNLDAQESSSMRVSYPLPKPGSEMTAIEWISQRNPTILSPGEPRVDPAKIVSAFDDFRGIQATLRRGSILELGSAESDLQMNYEPFDDSDPVNVTGGIRLDEFASQFNQVFVEESFRAIVVNGTAGYSMSVMVVKDEPDNQAVFSLLGHRYVAQPKLDIAYIISVSQPGSISSSIDIDADVEAGWICYDDDCRFEGRKVLPDSRSSSDITVVDGEPFLDFQFRMRPAVVVKRGLSTFSSIAPGIVRLKNSVITNKPSCSKTIDLKMGHDVSRMSRTFFTDDTELVDQFGVANEIEGCTGTGLPPSDCSFCEINEDSRCVEDVCGPDSACYFGKCSVPADFDLTLTWEYSNPAVDLDLWALLPDGKLVHPGRRNAGAASLANISDGGVSTSDEESGGSCEGDYDRACDGTPPVDGECPPTCLLLTEIEESPGRCVPEPVECADWFMRYYDCPSECRIYCDPDIDPSCSHQCYQDYGNVVCFECTGRVRLDFDDCALASNEAACEATETCNWSPGSTSTGDSYCVGGRVRCEELDRQGCAEVNDCDWVTPPPVERLEFPPFIERLVFSRQIDRPVEFWVVNRSGIEVDENIPFEISVRLRPDMNYALQGFVGPNAGDQSIKYRSALGE